MIKNTITYPNGKTYTRNSKNRAYTHAVIVLDDEGWGHWSFTGDAGKAQKEVNKLQSPRYTFTDVRVVEVTIS